MITWNTRQTKHFVFYTMDNSYADANIEKIMQEQESRIEEILCCFPIKIPVKIKYWLCNTREEVGEMTNDAPSNAMFVWDDDNTEDVSIYAVYSEDMQCTGYHEETHAVMHFLNEPLSTALSEGVAVYMERLWWGIENDLCAYLYIDKGCYVSVEQLICEKQKNEVEYFYAVKESVSYPTMGAFVGFLLSKDENGQENFLKIYQYQGEDWREEFQRIYQCSLGELENQFLDYIKNRIYSQNEIMYGEKRLGL
ncbi:MAG: hypothetical protein IJW18_01370 [Lachnospiraceae bacterium]|nr:hypothetical protein [Lachnospiraceae bacterium]